MNFKFREEKIYNLAFYMSQKCFEIQYSICHTKVNIKIWKHVCRLIRKWGSFVEFHWRITQKLIIKCFPCSHSKYYKCYRLLPDSWIPPSVWQGYYFCPHPLRIRVLSYLRDRSTAWFLFASRYPSHTRQCLRVNDAIKKIETSNQFVVFLHRHMNFFQVPIQNRI